MWKRVRFRARDKVYMACGGDRWGGKVGGIEEARYDHMPVPIEDITEEIVLLLRKGESLALVALAALAMGSCWSRAA